MHTYIIAVIIMVILLSLVLAYILHKNSLLSKSIIIATIISSITVSLLAPFILNTFLNISGSFSESFGTFIAYFASFVAYITLILLFSMVASLAVPARKSQQTANKANISLHENSKNKKNLKKNNTANEANHSDKSAQSGIECSIEVEESFKQEETESNMLEKFVDTTQNIDKMKVDVKSDIESIREKNHGILINTQAENYQPEPVDELALNLDCCINEAFRLKQEGNFEGAILYYTYALDKNPDKELVFWIVLDICVLYKALGQIELAREILESYISDYGTVMDDSIKCEIERNLLYI